VKKIIFSLIFFLTLFPYTVFAQAESISVSITSVTPSPTPTPVIVNYDLPYPGILPGKPLYSLKIVRDRIVEFFIGDSLKKSYFYLLQADKRLSASIYLFELNQNELGETTLSKSQNYLEKSLNKAGEAKNSQKDIGELAAKIKLSSIKQKQEIQKLINKSKGEIRLKLSEDLKRAESIQKSAEQLKPR